MGAAGAAAEPSSFHAMHVRTGASLEEGMTTSAFTDRRVIGWYSMDEGRRYHDDRRALKFYDPGTAERLTRSELVLNLSSGFQHSLITPGAQFAAEGLQPITTWMERHLHSCSPPPPPKFVTNRSSLKMMLNTPYLKPTDHNYKHWGIRAEKHGDSIHLSQSNPRPTPESEYLLVYQGYMYEKCLLSNEPGKTPVPNDTPLSTNEGFYCVFNAKVGGLHSMIYSAEMDAMVATEDVKGIYQRDHSFDHLDLNVEEFVELKTSKACYLYKDKMRAWWSQCSPVGVKTVVCGFKNDDEVRKSEEFSMENLGPDCGRYWKPEVCNDFLVRFLSKIRHLMDGMGGPQSITFKLSEGSVYGSY